MRRTAHSPIRVCNQTIAGLNLLMGARELTLANLSYIFAKQRMRYSCNPCPGFWDSSIIGSAGEGIRIWLLQTLGNECFFHAQLRVHKDFHVHYLLSFIGNIYVLETVMVIFSVECSRSDNFIAS